MYTLPNACGSNCGGDGSGDANSVDDRLTGGCQDFNRDAKDISLAGNQLLKSSVMLHYHGNSRRFPAYISLLSLEVPKEQGNEM